MKGAMDKEDKTKNTSNLSSYSSQDDNDKSDDDVSGGSYPSQDDDKSDDDLTGVHDDDDDYVPQCYRGLVAPYLSINGLRDLRKSIKNQTDVALGITKQLLVTEGKDKNMVYSPLSIHVVLSMLAAGSKKGPTLDQMLSFLKSSSMDELNDLASTLIPLVFADGSQNGGPRLSLANGIWHDKSVLVKPCFKQVMDTAYKATLHKVDFKTNPHEVRAEVNSWAEKETNGLVNEILPLELVHNKTRLILANAVYLKGAWVDKFDTPLIQRRFHLLNGSSVKATFMTSWNKDRYVSEFDDFKVIRLPYEQGEDQERCFSMYMYLPCTRDGLPDLVQRVCSESGFLDRYLPKVGEVGEFYIPKFKISSGFDAYELVETLGFCPGSLTEMVTGEDLFINTILHKSFIEVNEKGTEAAAATAYCFEAGADMDSPIDFVADHPFLFVIREEISGTVLFIGHVLNPNEGY